LIPIFILAAVGAGQERTAEHWAQLERLRQPSEPA